MMSSKTFEDTDRNGDTDVTAVLRIIDDKRSRYEVAKAVAAWHQADLDAKVREELENALAQCKEQFGDCNCAYINERLATLTQEAKS
jgi:uncharacterized protein YgiB involved in biofilm formation